MNHLKPYKIFESESSLYKEITIGDVLSKYGILTISKKNVEPIRSIVNKLGMMTLSISDREFNLASNGITVTIRQSSDEYFIVTTGSYYYLCDEIIGVEQCLQKEVIDWQLGKYNESVGDIGELYHKIKLNDYNYLMKGIREIEDSDLSKLILNLDSVDYKLDQTGDCLNIEVPKGILFFVSYVDDEYFIVKLNYRVYYDIYFKCDTIEGVIELMNKWI